VAEVKRELLFLLGKSLLRKIVLAFFLEIVSYRMIPLNIAFLVKFDEIIFLLFPQKASSNKLSH